MQKFVVHESSMRPVLEPGDRVLARRRPPSTGDIVVFPEPGGGRWFVKRLVAGPGAAVDIVGVELTITHADGRRISRRLPFSEPERHWIVADGQGFVLSEALDVTRADSRALGPLPAGDMQTVVLRYAPLRRFARRL